MKNKSISVIFSLASILLLSCSTSPSFNGDEEKVIKTFLKVRGWKGELCPVFEVKLIRDITAEDSVNYYLQDPRNPDAIIEDYNKTMENLKYRIATKNDPSQQYQEFQGSWLDKDIEDVNRFADAFDGKFDEKPWKYKKLFQDIYRLKNLPQNKVVGKIYSITYQNVHDKAKSTVMYVLEPNLEKTNGGTIDDLRMKPAPKFDLERIHFKHYVKE